MSIAQNFIDTQDQITKTADQFDAYHDLIRLVAVSKKQPDDRIGSALQYGHRIYGENRVQEAQGRWLDRCDHYPDLQLHLIGPLQTNKAKDAVALFDMIHTLDREKLARTLKKEMEKQARHIPCFIQVNTGEEDQKSGILPSETADFVNLCRDEIGLQIKGLMCIPPIDEPAALHFALLNKLADENGLNALSIGMSSDFEKAVPFAKTRKEIFIRVGSALFGERPDF